MGSCGLLDVQTEYRNRNKEVQEQLGTILAQGPRPKGARAAHVSRHTGQCRSEHPHVHTHEDPAAQSGTWWVVEGPQAGFRKDAVVQRPGSDRLRDGCTRVRPHFPLTIALYWTVS